MKKIIEKSNIILFTRGTMGDIYPFLHIGAELKKYGCRVTLMSNYCYEKYAIQEGFKFVALDDEHWFSYLNNMPESERKLPSLLKLYRDQIFTNLERELELVSQQVVPEDTVILAHSNDYMVPLFAKEKFSIPLFLCVLAPSFVYSLYFFEGVLKSLSDDVNKVREQVGLVPIIDWKQWMNSFDRSFAFWPDWFANDAQIIIPKLEHVGFPSVGHVEQRSLQTEIIEFLKGDIKTVAITHGTSRPFRENYFRLAIEACEKLGFKLLVITPFHEYLPESFPENIYVVDFCPFHELLPLVNLVIHHGGIGTVRESMASGTPQLIIGKGYDRPHNGKIVKNLNVGDWISPNALTAELLHSTVLNLLNSQDVSVSCDKRKSLLIDHKINSSFYDDVVSA